MSPSVKLPSTRSKKCTPWARRGAVDRWMRGMSVPPGWSGLYAALAASPPGGATAVQSWRRRPAPSDARHTCANRSSNSRRPPASHPFTGGRCRTSQSLKERWPAPGVRSLHAWPGPTARCCWATWAATAWTTPPPSARTDPTSADPTAADQTTAFCMIGLLPAGTRRHPRRQRREVLRRLRRLRRGLPRGSGGHEPHDVPHHLIGSEPGWFHPPCHHRPAGRGGRRAHQGGRGHHRPTGHAGAVAVLAALRGRDGQGVEGRVGSGRGQRIDLSLLESTVAWLINQAANHLVGGVVPTHGQPAPQHHAVRDDGRRPSPWRWARAAMDARRTRAGVRVVTNGAWAVGRFSVRDAADRRGLQHAARSRPRR